MTLKGKLKPIWRVANGTLNLVLTIVRPKMNPASDSDVDYSTAFQVLATDAYRRCDGVDAALEEILAELRGRPEDRSYRQFAEALRQANTGARALLEELCQAFDRVPEETYDRVLGLMGVFADHHERHVNYLRGARAEPLEVFSQPFTRTAKQLVPNAEVLFFGWSLDRYHVRTYGLTSANKLDGRVSENLERSFGQDIAFLQFLHPAMRQRDLFQHAVFAHELGHPAIRRRPSDHLLGRLGGDQKQPNFANVAVAQAGKTGFSAEHLERLSEWFYELACDVFAVRFIGPAFALAFVEATSANRYLERTGEQGNAEYPPIGLRLKVLGAEIDQFDWGERAAEIGPILGRITNSSISSRDPEKEIPGSVEWIEQALRVFREDSIPDLLGKLELDRACFRQEVSEVWDLTAQEVPPAEKLLIGIDELPADGLGAWSKEFDWRAIINGVLFWHLARVEAEDPDDATRIRWRNEAISLATGAIEMAEFQRRAGVLREQYRPMRLPQDLPEAWRP
jgi:hypothetical protein